MDIKIQELTEKIYREGVEKGNEEATRIISEANMQKQRLLSDAETEAKRIVANAEKQASELRKNTEAELKLFASQFVEGLKSEVTNLISEKIASSNAKAIATDKAFLQKFILEMAKEWSKNGGLTIQSKDVAELINYFESNAKELLNKGVKIEQVNGKGAPFTIIPSDGSYKVTFGEEEFLSFFKEFLRPQLVEILF